MLLPDTILQSYNEKIERRGDISMSEYDGAHNYVSSLEMRLSPDRDRKDKEVSINVNPMPFGEGIDYSAQTSADKKENIYVRHN